MRLLKPESDGTTDSTETDRQMERSSDSLQLIPQFFFICLGLGGAAVYLLRLARGPYVVWNKTKNPEPWNKLDPTYQYKFVAVNTDYKNLKKDGPKF